MSLLPVIIIKKERERALANRHPWLFSGAIAKIEGKPVAGDIVRIENQARQVLAHGHYQGEGPSIAARLFHFGAGQQNFDNAFWLERLHNALALRRASGLVDPGTGYRLINSEGDMIPGLVVDIFDDCASIQVGSSGIEALKGLVAEFLESELGIQHIFDGAWLKGHKPVVSFTENGLRLQAHIERGQKTGYFFDQRDNRKLVSRYAEGKTVLDAFSYSGGFSCNALLGKAKHVTAFDISKDAASIATSNVQANFGSDAPFEAVVTDCFEALRKMKVGAYDLIVLDPPAFSKSAHTVDKAARGYKDINLVAMQKIAKNGLLFTYSCSQHISADLFRKIIFGAAKDAGRQVQVLHQMTQGADHPIDICHPEGEYLKGLALRVI